MFASAGTSKENHRSSPTEAGLVGSSMLAAWAEIPKELGAVGKTFEPGPAL